MRKILRNEGGNVNGSVNGQGVKGGWVGCGLVEIGEEVN